MNYPQQAGGIKESFVIIFPKLSPPNVLIGGPVREFRLDSRLKHAGMTHFYNGINSMQQAVGNRTRRD
jgi:hypothetical protein